MDRELGTARHNCSCRWHNELQSMCGYTLSYLVVLKSQVPRSFLFLGLRSQFTCVGNKERRVNLCHKCSFQETCLTLSWLWQDYIKRAKLLVQHEPPNSAQKVPEDSRSATDLDREGNPRTAQNNRAQTPQKSNLPTPGAPRTRSGAYTPATRDPSLRGYLEYHGVWKI
jgi:hypothetical protein